MCLAQGHNAVTPVRLEPATHGSRLSYCAPSEEKFLNKTKGWMPDLSHGVASESNIMPYNTINKPLVVYRLSNLT